MSSTGVVSLVDDWSPHAERTTAQASTKAEATERRFMREMLAGALTTESHVVDYPS